MLDTGCWMLDAGYLMLDTRYRMLDACGRWLRAYQAAVILIKVRLAGQSQRAVETCARALDVYHNPYE